MTSTALYIDDDEQDQQVYAERISRSGALRVRSSFPPPDMNLDAILEPLPDLFLVDRELTKATRVGKGANYSGGTLATALREKAKDFPIVLITRESITDPDDPYIREVRQLLDGVVYKGDIDRNPAYEAARLDDLAEGFRQLRSCADTTWPQLLRLLRVEEGSDDEAFLQEAAPPLRANHWDALEVARWIQRVLLSYPGVLYDRLFASTLLGVSEASFGQKRALRIFEKAKYRGCFAGTSERWWRTRLIQIATHYVRSHGKTGPINREFASAFKDAEGVELEPATCVFSGEQPADWICYILRKPVMIKYSVVYFPDQRPQVMDQARVSFRALIESNEVDDAKIDPNARDLVTTIRRTPP